MKLPSISKKRMFDIIAILFLLIALILIRRPLGKVINPFIYAGVLAYILDPFVTKLEDKKIKRIFGILIVFVVIFGLLTLLLLTVIPRLARDITSFINDLPKLLVQLDGFLEDLKTGQITLFPEQIKEYFNIEENLNLLANKFGESLSGIVAVLVSSTGTLLDIIMTPIITFYFLNDKEKILATLQKPIPPKYMGKVKEIASDMDKVLGGFIRGQLLVAAFVGFLTGLGCFFIKVPHPLTIGLVAGITNIIPYFGPWIGGVLPVTLAFLESPTMALWVLILIIVVQQVESSFISPQVMSHSVGLHPLAVIFSVVFFGSMFGIPGMVIGVPLMGIIMVIYKHLMAFRTQLSDKERIV